MKHYEINEDELDYLVGKARFGLVKKGKSIEPLINLYNKISTQHQISVNMKVSFIGRREHADVFEVDGIRFEVGDDGNAVCNSGVNFSELYLCKVQEAINVFITNQLRDWRLNNEEAGVN